MQGYTTYVLKQDQMELRSTAYMWRVIENCLPAKIKSEVKGMTMFQDRYVRNFRIYHLQTRRSIPVLLCLNVYQIIALF